MPSTTTTKHTNNLVMVVGSANQDLTVVTSHVPQLGETVLGETFSTSAGGKGANQARAAAVLTDQCCLVCHLGKKDDVFGNNLRQSLHQAGVQVLEDTTTTTSSTSTVPSTGVASILVDAVSGDNSIVVVPGANHALTAVHVQTAIRTHRPRVLVVQLEIPLSTALAALKTAKTELLGDCTTILNPAPAPEQRSQLLTDLLSYTDILIPNETELRTLCCGVDTTNTDISEETLARDHLPGVRQAVVVTLGSRGALVVPKQQQQDGGAPAHHVSGPPVPHVVDTVGAGDAVCGSLAAYLASSSSDDSSSSSIDTLVQAATKACAMAGLSVARAGATYPRRDELPEALRCAAVVAPEQRLPSLTFVTGNANKLLEVQQILGDDLPWQITNQKIDLPELQGDPVEIAKEKCRLAAARTGGYCFTEDTSLCFNALNGMPGVYVKWFLDACGHDGLNSMLDGFEDRSGYAQTIVALQLNDGDDEIHVFDGRTDGTIVPARGSKDFGWDPIFEPTEGGGKTYAEMTKEEKNAISHRGRAFAKMRDFLLQRAKGADTM